MKNADLLAIGLTKEQCNAVQKLHHELMGDAMKAGKEKGRNEERSSSLRTAIVKISYLLDAENLRKVLLTASNLYAQQSEPEVTEKEKSHDEQ